MPVPPTPPLAAMLSLALLGASCSLTTDLSGLQRGTSASGGAGGGSPTTTTASTASGAPVCGDGFIQAGEECDDGNDNDHDECAGCVVQCDGEDEAKDPDTFHCYWYDDGFTTADFGDANSGCADWRSNGTLVTITTEEELFFLTVTNHTNPGAWIGATDMITSGKYLWVTGEPWEFSNWAPGYPDDMGGFASCISLGHQNLKWENTPCETSRDVICESSPVGKPAP
jgi:cysteine-rich repeat protein